MFMGGMCAHLQHDVYSLKKKVTATLLCRALVYVAFTSTE